MSKKSKVLKPENICKVKDCGATAKRDGFCATCYLKVDRGLINKDGQATGKALASQKKQREKERARAWESDTAFLREALKKKPSLLKVIQTEYPDTVKPVWCEKLDFWACEAACFNRMFVVEVPPDESCWKCHQHDLKFDWLKNYIGEKNAQESTK